MNVARLPVLYRPPHTGRQRVKSTCINLLVVFAIVYTAGAMLSPYWRLTLSFTDSLPSKVWLVHVGQVPVRGDYVAFRIPPNRFYPNRYGGFLKIVRGTAGDLVTRDGRRFSVNGQFVGTAKSVSRNGLPLDPGPVGMIPPDFYFVWTPEVDSFDSRYADIGWIAKDRIVGVARPVF
jgi:conjugal transfer pilin signal peptidase TrbI